MGLSWRPAKAVILHCRLWTLFLFAASVATGSIAQQPKVAGLVFKDIFPPGTLHAHSSSVVETADGGLIACWFYGSGERKADDVVIQGARFDPLQGRWSSTFQMADTPGFPDCNPVLFVDASERLWMFWICVLANRWECSQLKYRRADTTIGTKAPDWTWQDVINLKPGEPFRQALDSGFQDLGVQSGMWAEYARPYHKLLLSAAEDPHKRQTGWMTRTHPLTLPTGRILLPLYSDGFNVGLVAISDDLGKTWRSSLPIVGLAPIQPSLARKRGGELVAFCRDSGSAPGRVLQSVSRDEGQTWTPARDTEIANPGSSLEVLVLQDGRWLMVCNDTEEGRHRLVALVSEDEGQSWPVRRVLQSREADGLSFDYPSVIQARNGVIHLTFSHTSAAGRCIRHCQFSPQWLR